MRSMGLGILFAIVLPISQALAYPSQCADADPSNNFVPIIYRGYTVVFDNCEPPPPVPASPINLLATGKTDDYDVQFNLTWTLPNPSEVTAYVVEEVNPLGSIAEMAVVFGDLAFSLDKFGGPYGTYGYRVKACNAGGCSPWSSSQIQLATLDPVPQTPTNFQVQTPFVTSVAISWAAPTNGVTPTRYELEEDDVLIQNSAATSAVRTLSQFVDVVSYRVRACRNAFCGPYTGELSALQKPGPATALVYPTAKVIDGSYSVSWSPPTTGSQVEAYDLAENSDYVDLQGSMALSADFANKPDGTYIYRVHTCATSGCSISTPMTVVVDDPDAPSVPLNLAVPGTYFNNYTVSWASSLDGGDGIACYQLEEQQTGFAWAILPKACLAQSVAINHSSGAYNYRVRACTDVACSCSFAKPCSPWTAPRSTRLLQPPGVPLNFNVVSNITAANISWSAGGGDPNDAYTLQRRADGSSTWTSIPLNPESVTVRQDEPGVGTYHYRVRACNAAGCSDYTPSLSATILPAATPPPTFAELPGGTTTLPSNYDHVGATAGQFSVGSRGNASYVIPILTGPASGELVPELALSYDSQGGNGAVGLGWSVQGLSAIRRCSQSHEVDGSPSRTAVQFDNKDRFCLDGQRLILASGIYGGANATYRTEVDTFALVTSHGSAGTGPQYFTVRRRDGSISHYGNTDDSRPVTGLPDEVGTASVNEAQTVFAWALNRFQDSAGNYIALTYRGPDAGANIPGAVELLISQVDYAGNGSAQPTNRIDFVYETRTDMSVGHLAGASLARTLRLKRIDSQAKVSVPNPWSMLRSYHLTYGQDGLERSIVTSIQECSTAGIPSDAACFDATVFGWAETTNEISDQRRNQGALSSNAKTYRHGDFNGDGLRDLLYTVIDNRNLRVRAGTANATATFQSEINLGTIPQDSAPTLRIMDYNGDGKDDLVYLERVSTVKSEWKGRRGQMTPTGDLSFAAVETLGEIGVELRATSFPQVLVADLDGDGLADLLYELSKVFYKSINTSSRSSASFDVAVAMSLDTTDVPVPDEPQYILADTRYEMPTSAVGDFDGDGDADFLVRTRWRFDRCPNPPSPCIPDPTVPISMPAPGVLPPGQYNQGPVQPIQGGGSGVESGRKDEWRIGWVDGGVIRLGTGVLIDSGNVELCTDDSQDRCHLLSRVFVTDINIDGLADLAYRRGDSASLNVKINAGRDFRAIDTGQETLTIQNSHEAQLVDINGDGWPDVVYPEDPSGTAQWQVRYNRFGSFDGTAVQLHAPAGDTAGLVEPDPTVDHTNEALWTDINGDGKVDYYYIERHRTGPSNSEVEVIGDAIYFGRAGTNETYQVQNSITRITDGHGARTDIDYAAMPQAAVYAASAGTDDYSNAQLDGFGRGSPVYAFTQAGHYLVRQVSTLQPSFTLSDPASAAVTVNATPAAFNRTTYLYAGGKIQLGGRGFLGFRKIVTNNDSNHTQAVAINHQDYPFSGRNQSISTHVNGVAVDRSETTWIASPLVHSSGNSTQFVYASATKIQQWDLAGNAIGTTSTTNTYGEATQYGNPTKITMVVKDGNDTAVSSLTTDNTYTNKVGNSWHLGLLKTSMATASRNGADSVRNTRYDHHATSGLITLEVFQPGAHWLATRYQHDGFGNVTQTRICGKDFSHATQTENCDQTNALANAQDRIVAQSYDAHGRYVTQRYNALNHRVAHVLGFDIWGNPLQVADISRLQTYYRYDAFGREFFRFIGTGQWTKTLIYDTATGCPSGTAFRSVTTAVDGSQQEMCFDLNGRERERSQLGFGGSNNQIETRYDDRSRVIAQSEPSTGNPDHWTYTWYDDLDRPIQTQHTTGAREIFAYNKLDSYRKHSVTGQVTRERRSALGEVIQVDENPNDGNVLSGFTTPDFDPEERSTTTFRFDELGQLAWTDGPLTGVVDRVTYAYDTFGRQIQINDPDRGIWHSYFNVLGELLCRADSGNIGTRFAYDKLGRVTNRTDLNGISTVNSVCNGTSVIESATWSYDNNSNSNGYGQLLKSYLGAEATSPFVKTFQYDAYGRSQHIETRLDGTPYSEFLTYDPQGRLFQYFDAAPGASGTEYTYNASGHLSTLSEPTTGQVYEAVQTRNARNQLTQVKYNNGTITSSYTYRANDGAPDMFTTTSAIQSQIQLLDYAFDNAGRLDSRRDYGRAVAGGLRNNYERFFYDRLNRLKEVKFSASGPLPDANLTLREALSYDAGGRILSKTGVGNYNYTDACAAGAGGPHAVKKTGLSASHYCYDQRGNRISGPNGEFVQYNVTEKPIAITRNGSTAAIAYDSQRTRYKRVENGITKYYVGAVEIISQGANITYKRYVGNATVVTILPGGSQQVAYLHKDHLGSVHVVTDALGQITAQSSFDAFGQRRNPDTWDQTIFDISQIKTVTDLGFTGHEMLDGSDLIHMNGRVYDPQIGRFLSADPFMTEPLNGQNHDRYSYVSNDPLNGTDPSGYCEAICFAVTASILSSVVKTIDHEIAENQQLRVFRPDAPGVPNGGVASNGTTAIQLFNVMFHTRAAQQSEALIAAQVYARQTELLAERQLVIADMLRRSERIDQAIEERFGIAASSLYRVIFKHDVDASVQIFENGVNTQTIAWGSIQLIGGRFKRTYNSIKQLFRHSPDVSTVANKGTSVLGKYPDYMKLSNELGAKRFSIPTDVWNKMSKAEQWAANKKFLDRMIKRGDDIVLSNPVKNVKDVSGAFRKELDYLMEQGFKLSDDGVRLIK